MLPLHRRRRFNSPLYTENISQFWLEFKLWSWLEATKSLGLPISEEADKWYKHISTEDLKEGAIKLLGIFKEETSPVLDDYSEYELVYPTTPPLPRRRSNFCLVKNRGCHHFQTRTFNAYTMASLPLLSVISYYKKSVSSPKPFQVIKARKSKTILTKKHYPTISELTTWCGMKTLRLWGKTLN